MHKNLLLTLIGLVLLAGVGVFVVPEMLGGRSAVVEWGASDEVTVPDDSSDPDAQTVGNGELERSLVTTPKAPGTGGADDASRPAIALRGRVLDAFTQPLANAKVTLEFNRGAGAWGRGGPGGGPGGRGNRQGQDRQQVRKPVITGADGRFEFRGRGFESLSITLAVTHASHAPLFFDKDFEGAKGDLDAGDLNMLHGGAILGAVTDIDGNPVPGTVAHVNAAGMNRINFTRNREELLPKVEVDANGTFRIMNLMPGEYRIDATAPRKIGATTDVISVVDSQQEQIDPLRLGPGHVITGVVFATSTGLPVADADVQLTGGRGGRNHQAQTDKKGEFTIDHLPSDAVTVRVQAKGFITWSQAGVLPPAGIAIVAKLLDGMKITGLAQDAVTSAPVTRYAARARRVGGLGNPTGENDAGRVDIESMRARMREIANGESQITPEEIAQLRTRTEEAPRRIQRGGNVATPEGTPGVAITDETRARFEEMGRQMRERGQGGGPGSRGRDQQRPDRGGERRGPGGGQNGDGANPIGDLGEVVARPEGKFSFTGLDEGIYVVEIASPDHQKVRSERVTLRQGSVAPNLTLLLPRGLNVSGKASSTDGQPLAKARVELVTVNAAARELDAQIPQGVRGFMRQLQGNGPTGTPVLDTETDKEGKFALRHAPPGRYQLVARADGHSRKVTDEFDLTADVADVPLVLGALSVIDGRVVGVPKGKELDVTVIAFAGPGNTKTVKAKPEGNYELTDLQPGGYIVRAFIGDMRTFMRFEMGQMMGRGADAEAMHTDVTLAEGERKSFDVRVSLHPTGNVAGNVLKNGMPAKAFRVQLISLESAQAVDANARGGRGGRGGPGGGRMGGGGIQPAMTDQNGAFKFNDVPEGRYQLRVTPGNNGQEVHRQEVEVRAEITSRVTASFVSGSLQGRVASEDGAKPSELSGSLMLYANTKTLPTDVNEFGKTNAVLRVPVRSGAFQLPDVQSGDYLLVLNIGGRERVQQSVYVPTGDTLTLDLKAGKKNAPTDANGPKAPTQNPRRQGR